MDKRLKTVLQWSIFVLLMLIIVLMLIIPLACWVFSTIFKFDFDSSGISEIFGIAGVIISFLSAGLGCFSIWQANHGTQQTNKILEEVDSIKKQNDILKSMISLQQPNINYGSAETSNSQCWSTDNVVD